MISIFPISRFRVILNNLSLIVLIILVLNITVLRLVFNICNSIVCIFYLLNLFAIKNCRGIVHTKHALSINDPCAMLYMNFTIGS
jgi:hypothetical protein